MSTSRSSASESESFAENDVSFEESVDDNSSSNNNPSSHHYHLHQQAPSPLPQQPTSSTRQKHYFVENAPNVRYVVHTNSSGSSTNGNNISLMPNYQMKGNSLLPSAQFGSQYFMDNNLIHRTYSYYNQPQASMPKYPPNFKEFPGAKNPEIVSVRYIAQPPHPNGTLMGKDGEAFIYRNGSQPQPGAASFMQYPAPPGPYQYGPYKDRPILFGRDSYGTEQNFYYPGSFYNNQAYEMGSQRVLNYDLNPSNIPDPKHRNKPVHELIKQVENHEPISSQWNISGGFGNSYGMNQKFYKELIDSSNQSNFNQFYSDNPNPNSNNNNNKDKTNYLGFVNANGSSKKLKIIVSCILLALILLAICVCILIGFLYPKPFLIQPANSRSANLAVLNITLNATDPIKPISNDTILSKINQIHLVNLTNETIVAPVDNKTSIELVSTTTLLSLLDLTSTTATPSLIVKSDTSLTTVEAISTETSSTTTLSSSTSTISLNETFKVEDITTTTISSTTSEVPSTTELIIENDQVDMSSTTTQLSEISSTLAQITSTLSIASTTTPISVNERLIFVDTTTTPSISFDETTTLIEETTIQPIDTTTIDSVITTNSIETTDSIIAKIDSLIDSNSTVINNSTSLINNDQPFNSTDILQF